MSRKLSFDNALLRSLFIVSVFVITLCYMEVTHADQSCDYIHSVSGHNCNNDVLSCFNKRVGISLKTIPDATSKSGYTYIVTEIPTSCSLGLSFLCSLGGHFEPDSSPTTTRISYESVSKFGSVGKNGIITGVSFPPKYVGSNIQLKLYDVSVSDISKLATGDGVNFSDYDKSAVSYVCGVATPGSSNIFKSQYWSCLAGYSMDVIGCTKKIYMPAPPTFNISVVPSSFINVSPKIDGGSTFNMPIVAIQDAVEGSVASTLKQPFSYDIAKEWKDSGRNWDNQTGSCGTFSYNNVTYCSLVSNSPPWDHICLYAYNGKASDRPKSTDLIFEIGCAPRPSIVENTQIIIYPHYQTFKKDNLRYQGIIPLIIYGASINSVIGTDIDGNPIKVVKLAVNNASSSMASLQQNTQTNIPATTVYQLINTVTNSAPQCSIFMNTDVKDAQKNVYGNKKKCALNTNVSVSVPSSKDVEWNTESLVALCNNKSFVESQTPSSKEIDPIGIIPIREYYPITSPQNPGKKDVISFSYGTDTMILNNHMTKIKTVIPSITSKSGLQIEMPVYVSVTTPSTQSNTQSTPTSTPSSLQNLNTDVTNKSSGTSQVSNNDNCYLVKNFGKDDSPPALVYGGDRFRDYCYCAGVNVNGVSSSKVTCAATTGSTDWSGGCQKNPSQSCSCPLCLSNSSYIDSEKSFCPGSYPVETITATSDISDNLPQYICLMTTSNGWDFISGINQPLQQPTDYSNQILPSLMCTNLPGCIGESTTIDNAGNAMWKDTDFGATSIGSCDANNGYYPFVISYSLIDNGDGYASANAEIAANVGLLAQKGYLSQNDAPNLYSYLNSKGNSNALQCVVTYPLGTCVGGVIGQIQNSCISTKKLGDKDKPLKCGTTITQQQAKLLPKKQSQSQQQTQSQQTQSGGAGNGWRQQSGGEGVGQQQSPSSGAGGIPFAIPNAPGIPGI